jgi:hypothetical protein
MEVFIMKKSIITLMVLFTFLIFASGTAFSADEAKDRPGAAGQDRQPGAMMGKDQPGAMMGQQGGLSFNQPQRLSEIMVSDVVNHQGEELGTIDDLVANEQGQLEYLILARGGVLGVGANLIAIPSGCGIAPNYRRKSVENQCRGSHSRSGTDFCCRRLPGFFRPAMATGIPWLFPERRRDISWHEGPRAFSGHAAAGSVSRYAARANTKRRSAGWDHATQGRHPQRRDDAQGKR